MDHSSFEKDAQEHVHFCTLDSARGSLGGFMHMCGASVHFASLGCHLEGQISCIFVVLPLILSCSGLWWQNGSQMVSGDSF